MGKLSQVDFEIASYFAPKLFEAVMRGESAICVWFPGSGKTTIVRDILSNKNILKSPLKNLYKTLVLIPISLYETEEASYQEVLNLIAAKIGVEETSVTSGLKKIMENGNEVVLIVDWLEAINKKNFENTKILVKNSKMKSIGISF